MIVEESSDPTLVLLHLVMSLQTTWIPLETWLLSAGDANLGMMEGRTKVAVGVLCHLRRMFERHEIPPRKMYNTHLDLIKTFFVNAETREVISLLSYMCMRKMYRAVNRVTDEIELKKACCGIVAEVLRAPDDNQNTKELVDAWWGGDALHGLPLTLERYFLLCKQGLCSNSPIWTEHDSGSYQTRSSTVNYDPAWSCEGLENSTVKQKLEELGFVNPVRITIIELPRTEPLQRPEQSPRTRVPECFKGLAIALTVNTMTVSVIDDILHQHESTDYQGPGGKRLMMIDYNSNQWQHDAGPVQPKMSHIEPDNTQPRDSADFSFRDVETDVTFFTHAIFGEDGTPWQSLQNSASMTYDSGLFDTGMFDTVDSLEQDPSTTLPAAIEAPPDSNAAPLLIVSELDLQNIDYTVVEADIESWRVPWMAVPPASPSDQDDANAETIASAADMFNVRDSLQGFFPHINQAYETDTRRNTIDIMNDREHESDAVAEQGELDPALGETQSNAQDTTPGLPGHKAGVPDNRAMRTGTRERSRRPNVRQPHAGTQEPILSHSSTYTSDEPQPLRIATRSDNDFLTRCSKWRSNGVQHEDLNDDYGNAYTPYHTMTFITPLLWETYDPTAALKPISAAPQTDPSAGLESHCCHGGCRDTDLTEGVCRTATNISERNYMMGVEGNAKFCRPFHMPDNFNYTPSDIPWVTLDAKNGRRTYYAVDLSKPPQQGFRHVHLITNEFPLPNRPHGILEIVTSQALYLGHVLTVSNVEGLLIHRVFTDDMGVLDAVLNMHTRLQIHPFVPRTFAMELMAMPFTHTGVTANFVGEHAGEWNLGSSDGLANMNDGQKCKLAYHVALCLIKAQILTMSILGFPLLRLHPTRIWRHSTGFRLDFLACLLDHITAKLNSKPAVVNTTRSVNRERLDSPIRPVAGGVRAITITLKLLGLDKFTPIRLHDDDERETIDVFYDMYLQLTQQEGRLLELLSLLGEDNVYQSFTVPTSDCLAEPFAPFFIQIHNQYVKWNKAVVVEPVQNEDILPTPQLYPHVGPPKVKFYKRRQPASRDQLQDGVPVSTSADALARESNATQSQIMPPPVQVARAPRARSRRDNSERSCPDTRAIQSNTAARPRSQTVRATRGRSRRPVTAQHAATSRPTQQTAPVHTPEPTNYTSILDDDYDMNTCGSTYYDG